MRGSSVMACGVSAVLLAGCWSARPSGTLPGGEGFGKGFTDDGEPAGSKRERNPSGAIVFTETQLVEANIPLLDLMRRRIAGLQIQSTPLCPEIVLRGRSTVQTSSSPAIYVQGMQASNTCILAEMNTADIARVEIYPNGVPARPGYRTHPYGVILIFVQGVPES